MYNQAFMVPNPLGPGQSISIDPEFCIACNQCADTCRNSVMVHNPEKDQPPVVMYPDECWFCGCCTINCPTGAIKMIHPINQKIAFKRKATGELFRVGQNNCPQPNTKPMAFEFRLPYPKSRKIELKVSEVVQLARFVVCVRLKADTPFDQNSYTAGHFCNIEIENHRYRGYSIANRPGTNRLEFLIDTFPNGPGVKFLKTLTVGKTVKLLFPMGRFVYRPGSDPAIFAGSVTGLAPLKAMIETELELIQSGRKMELLFSVFDVQDIILYEYLDALAAKYENFNYTIFLSNPGTKAEKAGKIYNGSVHDYINKNIEIDDKTQIYMCGSKEYIQGLEKALVQKGAFWGNIFYESIF